MRRFDVIRATVRAKVLFATKTQNRELMVLIQDISYTAEDPPSGREKTGRVVYEDFVKRAKFKVVKACDDAGFWGRYLRLCDGDIIKFSIKRENHLDYLFTSLEIEGEQDCCYGINGLADIINEYNQEQAQ